MAKHGIATITLRSSNLERTERFYHELFGWDMYRMTKDYLGFDPPSGMGGGFLKGNGITAGDSFTSYVEVSEFEPYLEKARSLGGQCRGSRRACPGICLVHGASGSRQ
ncbi:hypothetical protein GWN42_03935 [candidate division KSB1 bacterium]|nr:hypothetical protein [candidate division KSB1 bacterium]NIR68904.1 hypothetical protein [candidate division KSB1 bacterium]NIS24029.1 hypothetical protein [candidate division KSB1 bacterium]NIU24679.1 hypothetical protein [candidate division KSB1 bacterium]NIU89844.1 hypothetical protein [candidate division KSB1 bacterium]